MDSRQAVFKRRLFKHPLWGLLGLTLFLWTIEIVDQVWLGGGLDRYGIMPRRWLGLRGILLAPFLHGGFEHLAANTLPLLGLSLLVMGLGDWWLTTLLALLTAGTGTWLIAATGSVHIGASGVIFGYIGCLTLRGYFERSPVAIGVSILTIGLYGGSLGGVLPGQAGVSWEGHLFGFLGGALVAWVRSRKRGSQH
ncbi:MAG: rhomboid family intramembrane serine protease [Cyanobacteria bacterium J06554_6]